LPDVRYLRKVINGVPVVAAPAEIDITTAEQLRAVLVEAAGGGHPTIVVDMTRTLFCDSSGLHTLLRLVLPTDGAVTRIVNLTCLNSFIPCFSSLAEALARGSAGVTAH
jgi:anti-sigma B factor antagonist